MGYTFKVGNAKPFHREEDGQLVAGWEVEPATHTDAPTFPNDGMTGNSNARSPSYSAWHEFCYETGIQDVFYDPDRTGHLKAGHPGCQKITHNDLEIVRLARKRCEATATMPPGFAGGPAFDRRLNQWVYTDDDKYDALLARLIWLEWWMDWALKNCTVPAIQNT